MKSELEILTRGVSEVIDVAHLEEKLRSGKKLRVKLGVDPTSPNIHIGRAVVLWKLREFQDLGHTAVLIVGDFTGQIGDTSDKDAERPMLSEDEVKKNMKSYFQQAFKILDKRKTETKYNSTWLKKLGFMEIGRIADLFGLHEFASRELIKKRIDAGKRVSLRELLYPLMQGYDSVAVRADVELGGTDQRFNMLAGRTIQPAYGQQPQDILITKFPLTGTDGRKMSSSWGNVINITDAPGDIFGKVMSITDALIPEYLEMAARLPQAEIDVLLTQMKNGANPREIKSRLAYEVVALYHGTEEARKAQIEFDRVFSTGALPEEIPEHPGAGMTVIDFMTAYQFASSKGEAKRLVDQKAVKINEAPVTSWEVQLKTGDIIQVGPRKFGRVR
ncbi:MAG TPA: tyrosine--tRNA ligase [Candidatus Paceibacterota bacterium]|nr:tyrosine--tRNA ligase [Candidatus Paceibacterota bacterium]